MKFNIQTLWTSFGSLSIGAGFLAIAAVVLLGGCDLREIVEIENPSWDEASVEALGYLGYDDADIKLTVCGNCHVDQQSKWQTTAMLEHGRVYSPVIMQLNIAKDAIRFPRMVTWLLNLLGTKRLATSVIMMFNVKAAMVVGKFTPQVQVQHNLLPRSIWVMSKT